MFELILSYEYKYFVYEDEVSPQKNKKKLCIVSGRGGHLPPMKYQNYKLLRWNKIWATEVVIMTIIW